MPSLDRESALPYLSAGRHRLEYEWHGPAPEAAPTLVFLHEGLGCVSLWRDFPARLAAATGCGALVYSRAGYGGSDPVALPRGPRFMHHEGLVVLPEVLAAAGVREAILVGHSDGGSIALVYAGSREKAEEPRLHGLALEAPHVFCEDVTVAAISSAVEAYREGDLRRALERHHGANVDVAFHGWSGAWLEPAFRAWTIEEYLPAVRVPVLVVQGEEDAYGTIRQVEAIEAGCRGAVRRLLLPGCGHSPHGEEPEATLRAMAEFVREALTAGPARI
jgi:pimeloyl-ACP methyl ester carboxylesterase